MELGAVRKKKKLAVGVQITQEESRVPVQYQTHCAQNGLHSNLPSLRSDLLKQESNKQYYINPTKCISNVDWFNRSYDFSK